jgi:hypothetical protein
MLIALTYKIVYDHCNLGVTEMRCKVLRLSLIFLVTVCLVGVVDADLIIVAIGDLHGDLQATRRALQIAGAIDDQDRWIGDKLVVVQTGDQLDRGDNEQAILDLLTCLSKEAAQVGGALHVLNGNHELMNVKMDLRYVTPGGFEDFQDAVIVTEIDSMLVEFDEGQRARVFAFRPGGVYAKVLARRNTVAIIGQNVFVHGGVLPEHVDYGLERLNAELRTWMKGEGPIPEWTHEKDSPVWMRHYSSEVDEEDCELLTEVLDRLGAKRMITGHSVQKNGIASYCDGKVWCIDTGMSSYYGGEVQVLEIRGDTIRVLSDK